MTQFNDIAIVGVGLIGGSLGLALKRKIPDVKITGVSSEKVLEQALSIGAIDQAVPKTNLQKGVEKADLVFLCNPISEVIKLLPGVSEAVQPGTLVTDAGSTKRKIVEEAAHHFRENKYFLGGHPMAGSEGRGIQCADALLFENAVYILTPYQQVPDTLIENLGKLIELIGAKVLFLNPTMHDKVAAAISHLPQILAVTLVNLVARYEKDSTLFLKLAAGGFRDMTRIASSPYEIWRDILKTNHEQVSYFIDEFIEILRYNQDNLKEPNLAKSFRNAGECRLSIPRDTKGFLRPHFDLSVQVEDKPGVIAAIATALANKNINIKDIEVLKVREGESGTLRLSFETPEARKNAQNILKQIGYSSRSRN